ncbi:hypothetical protein EDB89DRAFT_1903246 [Lactarius sanguifluus]|nr:hypothetical protein EDB89DRAFT_1903246 [Lactarius sanguifluus]
MTQPHLGVHPKYIQTQSRRLRQSKQQPCQRHANHDKDKTKHGPKSTYQPQALSCQHKSPTTQRRQLNHNDGADHDDNTTTMTIGTCKATSNGRKPKLARNSDDNDSRRRFKTTIQDDAADNSGDGTSVGGRDDVQ